MHRLLLAFFLLLAGAASAVEDAASPESFPYLGTWHVLLHYRDMSSVDPDRWRWEDRVWQFHGEGDRLVWTEYLLVNFVDNEGRFSNLGTNMAARILGAWEPNGRQRKQIESGLDVTARAVRAKRLEWLPGEVGSWTSDRGAAALSKATSGSLYLSAWSIEGDLARPRFRQSDDLWQAGQREAVGATRYDSLAFDKGRRELRGKYERDGERFGRFRMVPTSVAVGGPATPNAKGHVRMQPAGGGDSRGPLLLAMLRPRFYFGERLLEIETTPPGAYLDIQYIRRGTQLERLEARSPATVELPSRFSAGAVDVVRIRAHAPGYVRGGAVVDVRSSTDHVRVDLEPVPNRLLGVRHRSLAGRDVVSLVSREPPVLRTRRTPDEVSVVILDTSAEEGVSEAVAGLQSSFFQSVEPVQAGLDLILTFRLSDAARDAGVAMRTFSAEDPVRGVHLTRLDWSVPDDRAAWVERVQKALARMGPDDVSGCASVFESTLRAALTPEAMLAGPAGAPAFLRPVYRAALRRLATLSPDAVLHLTDGSSLDATVLLELELALQQVDRIEGYAALLRALVRELERAPARRTAAHGLLAPNIPAARFSEAWDSAAASETRCHE
ncbi:MAG: hypothetical protein O7A09_02730 [Proteobacteria bacterium]|nr:hypothetical protein [Pseudomonadota bacterium]